MRKTRSASTLQSRLRAWSFGLNVILGLAVFAFLWFGDIGVRGSLDRAVLPRAEGGSLLNPFDLNARKLILFAILTASALVIWRSERGREDRHDIFVLVGVLLLVLGGLNGSQGAEEMTWRMRAPMGLRDIGLDKYLLLVALGSVSVLAGLVRIALDPTRRGALLGACALFTLLSMSWVSHRFLMTPTWAQPMNAPGYSVQNLALVSTSSFAMSRSLEVWPDLVEVAERDGRAVPIAGGKDLDERTLATHVEELLADATRWNTRRFQRAGLEVWVRADAALSAKQVIAVLDRCADAGAKRFELVTRKAEPWVIGRVEIYAQGAEELTELEVRASAEGGFLFRLDGLDSTDVRALLPWINRASVLLPNREKFVVVVEPDLSWQDVATVLEEIDWFSRQLSLGLLEDE